MIERCLELKEIINTLSKDYPDLFLESEEWSFATEFLGLFKPIYNATIKLQSEQLCYSELYIIVMDITFQIDALPDSNMKTLLKESLNIRKDKLLENELFNAAVFLDPRIKVCLTCEQKQRAKNYILSLYKRMNSTEEHNTSHPILEEAPSPSRPDAAKSFSDYLQIIDPTTEIPSSSNLHNLEADFALNENIIAFWNSQKTIISEIANIVQAIPSTQEKLVSSKINMENIAGFWKSELALDWTISQKV
ncbi:uncharacterized protein [Musca autumnalis]|uniref:uncharacterized protein n=1 Tax=Musca autumnalis TaxID=221902 RepID=UPI003CF694E4